ncbi:hypothetical protein HYFRA_00007300 [Hymenoscyphus fraxineus]|uniref:Uncharacterized protein n=1 Tax=Hymenoscyphus fraxineus TaxID=746836 RepID=A0A9N9KRI1_9HELO|nr:hypothetical protein HYFRA_00007300 [Hymenoscyphus fraxineus]
MPTKGMLWVNSRITSTSLTKSSFEEWYNEEHVPDVLNTKAISSACRYNNINPADSHPYLALYPFEDIGFFETKRFREIPARSEKYFPGGETCFDLAEFDTRIYEWVHGYEKPGVKSGPAKMIISAGLTPAKGTDADFDAWYKEEHYGTLAECPGYIRTRRYKLKTALSASSLETPRSPQMYLALHEFDVESLPTAELDKAAQTEWAKRVMGSLQGAEVMVFKLEREFGDVKAKF